MSSANEIRDLNKIYLEAVYGGTPKKKEEPKDTRHVVTRADKVGNTPAYQKLKAGDKNYKAADHLKDDKDWGYDKEGNSLNPVDIEKKKKKDDDLAGAPNKVKKEALEHYRSLIAEKEVKVKDTRRTVDAIRAYDKSKDASRDATYDTDEGDKEKAAIEKKYAKKERGEIDKDDPNWKKRKYHTGIHGEEVEPLKRLVEAGKFSDEEIETMAWDVYEGLVEPAGTSDVAVDKATRKAATRKFGNTTPPKAKIPEGYQRNPEKGEEEERKAEKRRKESGRMPPRGDKRREDFEKWYAANVR